MRTGVSAKRAGSQEAGEKRCSRLLSGGMVRVASDGSTGTPLKASEARVIEYNLTVTRLFSSVQNLSEQTRKENRKLTSSSIFASSFLVETETCPDPVSRLVSFGSFYGYPRQTCSFKPSPTLPLIFLPRVQNSLVKIKKPET